MANGGAFGNPLTTGIALNFEVDMTPYRQMMQDNLQFAQTQAAERKKKEKEFQDILKNIAYDDSKIHQRMRDDARVEYAATIEDVMELKKKNDFGGIMNRIAKFDSKLNNYVDNTTKFRAYEKAAEDGKSWVDMDYINAFNNPEKFDDRYLIDNFSDVATYDKEAGVFSAQAIPKQDEVAFVNNYMQGTKDQFVRDNQGKIKRSGFLSETGDYVYLKAKSADPESFYQELGIAWLGGGLNNIEHMRRKMGLKPEDLEGSINTSSGPVAKSLYHATEFMKGVAEPKMYSEELRGPAKTSGTGGKTPFEKVVVQSPVSTEVNVMSEPQMQEVVIGQDAIDRMFDPAIPGSVTSNSFKMEQDDGESYLIEAMRGLGFETEATGKLGADKVVIKNPKTNKTHTVEFDYDEDNEQNLRDRELEKLKNWINNNANREQQEVAGEPILSYNQTVAFPSSKIFDMPIGKNDIIVDENGGKVIDFETQDLPVEIQETVTDKDGNKWYKATVFADVTAQAVASGTIFDPTLSEGDPGYERPKIQKTVFIKEDQAKLRKMAAKLSMTYDEILKLTRGVGDSGSATVKTITKAQAKTLMSRGGFSTEAELIADMKNRGISLKITP